MTARIAAEPATSRAAPATSLTSSVGTATSIGIRRATPTASGRSLPGRSVRLSPRRTGEPHRSGGPRPGPVPALASTRTHRLRTGWQAESRGRMAASGRRRSAQEDRSDSGGGLSRVTAITHVISDTCPWPQRRGLACGIVAPTYEQSKVYPFAGKAKYEVVVYIPDDPLARGDSWWSCVMDRQHLVEVERRVRGAG